MVRTSKEAGITQALAQFSAGLTYEDLSPEVVDRAKYLCLDFAGVTLNGSTTPSARAVVQSIEAIGRPGPSAIIGTASRTLPEYAAMANGTAFHSIELDDVNNEASLHPGVVAIGHINIPIPISTNIVGKVELTWFVSRLTPGVLQSPIGGVFMHLGVAVAIGDKELARMGVDGHMGALVEGLAAHGFSGLPTGPDGHQDLSLRRTLAHRVVIGIGKPDGMVGAYGDRVGVRKHLFVAPGMQKVPVAVQYNHGMVTSIKQVDVALRVHPHTCHVVHNPSLGHLGPVFYHLVYILTDAGLKRHMQSSLLQTLDGGSPLHAMSTQDEGFIADGL